MKTQKKVPVKFHGGPLDGQDGEYIGGMNYRHAFIDGDGMASAWYEAKPIYDDGYQLKSVTWEYKGVSKP